MQESYSCVPTLFSVLFVFTIFILFKAKRESQAEGHTVRDMLSASAPYVHALCGFCVGYALPRSSFIQDAYMCVCVYFQLAIAPCDGGGLGECDHLGKTNTHTHGRTINTQSHILCK